MCIADFKNAVANETREYRNVDVLGLRVLPALHDGLSRGFR